MSTLAIIALIVYVLLRFNLDLFFFILNHRLISVSILLIVVMFISLLVLLGSFSAEDKLESVIELPESYKYAIGSGTVALLCFAMLLIINVKDGLTLFIDNVDIIVAFLSVFSLCCFVAYVGKRRVYYFMNNAFIDGASIYELAWLLRRLGNVTETEDNKKLFMITLDLADISYAIKKLSLNAPRDNFNKFIDSLYGSKTVLMLDYRTLHSELLMLKIKAITKGVLAILIGTIFLLPNSILPMSNMLPIDSLYIKIIVGILITIKAPLFLVPILTYFYWLFLMDFVGRIIQVMNPIIGVIIEITVLILSLFLYAVLVVAAMSFHEDPYNEAKIKKIMHFLINNGIFINDDKIKQAKQHLKEVYNNIAEIITKKMHLKNKTPSPQNQE